MTTIAWDGVSLAADSLHAVGNWAYSGDDKIYQLRRSDEDCLFAGAGTSDLVEQVFFWLSGVVSERPIVGDKDDFRGLLITPTGAYGLEERLTPFSVPAPYAIGSGRDFALAAMALGKTAKEAVELACKLDLYTGGTVIEARLKSKAGAGGKRNASQRKR